MRHLYVTGIAKIKRPDITKSFFFFLSLVFERERAVEGQRERERERIPSRLCTVSAESGVGLELTDREIMT